MTPDQLRDTLATRRAETVNHPLHFGGADNLYETIKVIEAWGLGFCLGNTLKYISRAGKKDDALEDLKKARWYLDREIEALARLDVSVTAQRQQPAPVPIDKPKRAQSLADVTRDMILKDYEGRPLPASIDDLPTHYREGAMDRTLYAALNRAHIKRNKSPALPPAHEGEPVSGGVGLHKVAAE